MNNTSMIIQTNPVFYKQKSKLFKMNNNNLDFYKLSTFIKQMDSFHFIFFKYFTLKL